MHERGKKCPFLHITSLRRAVFLAIILMAAAVLVVIYFYINMIRSFDRQANYNFLQLTDNIRERFETSFDEIIDIAQYATYSNAFQKYLLSDTPGTVIEAKEATIDVLNFMSYSMGNTRDIVLLSSKGRKLSVTNSYVPVAEAAMNSLGLQTDATFHNLRYSSVINYKGEAYLVCLMSAPGSIDGYRTPDNVIITCIIYDLKSLLDILSLKGYDGSTVILMLDGEILGNSGEALSQNLQMELNNLQKNDTTVFADGRSWFTCKEKIGPTDWELTYLVPKSSMSSLISGGWTVIFILMLMLFISLLILRLLITVHRDIRHMVKDLTYRNEETFPIRVPQMEEFQIITTTLTDTLQNLREANHQKQQLTADRYEALLAQKQAEMQAYRRQINPHFLFNTLETIRSLAHHYQIEPLEQLISGMSQMFRYSLYSSTMVKLSDELNHLDGYISVINVRFLGRYQIKQSISPDVLAFPVLSMLLQPIVENAIQHAFKGRKQGKVLIQAFPRKDGRLSIRITDNGTGLTSDELAAIHQRIRQEETKADMEGSSIGLINIRNRLKLAFGEHAHLLITSKTGYYTCVEVIIPRI